MDADSPSELPVYDYVSPGLSIIRPDFAFPEMVAGDTQTPRWRWLRRWVEQNWYTDYRNPDVGFASRDEAAIIFNAARLVRGKPCLEIGCWRGWSAVHLALGSGMLDIVDPVIADPDFAESLHKSCDAAGVLDAVTFHAGFSPAAVDALASATGKKWSLIFVDGDHEGDGPRRDAEAAMRHAAETAMVLFHDLASPFVAAGLDAMRNAGWRTMVYQTMQIMGVAWRGDVEPPEHIPDPNVFWTLPGHLAGYHVSGWKRPTIRPDGGWWVGMTMADRRDAAMMRAQAAENDLTLQLALVDQLQGQVDQLQGQVDQLHGEIATHRQHIDTLRDELDRSNAQAATSRATADLIVRDLRISLLDSQRTVGVLTQRLHSVENSTFWRASGPLRRMGGRLPSGVRTNVARAARLLWWTVSLQLPTRLRERASRTHKLGAAIDQAAGRLTAQASKTLSLREAERPIVLIIDDRWPEPDRDGGSIDAINLINAMRVLGFDVIMAATNDYAGTSRYRDAVVNLGARCLGPSDSPSVQAFIEAHGEMVSLYVLTRFTAGGQYLELIRHNWPKAKIVFNTVDLHFLREEREARLLDDAERLQSAGRTRDREEFLVHRSDATIVVSAFEHTLLAGAVPGANIIELPLARLGQPPKSGFAERRDIGFIGSFDHMPNVDAVRYFLADIWPLIRRRLPGCRFSIVGSGLGADALREAPSDVQYLGHLPDVAPWFDRLRVSVAPLRYGAGMKGKVVSSLAAGLPCVGTPIAVEGMALTPGQDILVGETPEAFADAVVRAYEDEALWTHLSEAGRIYVEQKNSIRSYTRRLHEMLIALGLPCITPP
jgi:glycosyltransferase involved in cell wall biosynthesis/predicted O-methyltransferase YrrM